MTDLNQLLLKFNYKQNFNYDDFFVSKSNFFAFELIEKWPRWEKNILNIYGDKFSGKTHLANIFYNKNKGIKIYENEINNEMFKKFKLYENIIIDDFKNETEEKLLYSLFNLVDIDSPNRLRVIKALRSIVRDLLSFCCTSDDFFVLETVAGGSISAQTVSTTK